MVPRVVKLFIQVLLTACFLCAHGVQSSIGHPWKGRQQQAKSVSLGGGRKHVAKELGDWRTGVTSSGGRRRPGATLSSHPCLLDGKLQSLTSILGHNNLVDKETPGLAGTHHPRTLYLSSIKSYLPIYIKGRRRLKKNSYSLGASEIAYPVKVLTTGPDHPSSIPGIYMVDWENKLL